MEAAPGPRLRARLRRWAPELAFLGLWLGQGALAWATPALADEAYYRLWADQLQLGYLDHPPGVAAWMALGGGTARALTWACTGGAWWGLAVVLRRLGAERWRWLPALGLATPLGFSHALIITPDAPATLAWFATVSAAVLRRPVWAGVGVALGLWSKSTVVLALPGLCWVLGVRGSLQMAATASVLYGPQIAWSVQHGGLPWTFQSGRAMGGGAPVGWVAGQLAALGPALAWAVVRAWRGPLDEAGRTLVRLSAPTALAWLAVACVTRAEVNWGALAWPAALMLVVLRHPALPRLVAWGAGWTAVGGLGWAAVARLAPLGWGPPRDGARLARCLDAHSLGGPWVAGRYQEAALLRLAGRPVGYLRAAQHRESELDRRPLGEAPACDFWYLAAPRRLPTCAGGRSRSAACGLDLTWCACATDAPRRVTPGASPAYAPSLQPSGGGPGERDRHRHRPWDE